MFKFQLGVSKTKDVIFFSSKFMDLLNFVSFGPLIKNPCKWNLVHTRGYWFFRRILPLQNTAGYCLSFGPGDELSCLPLFATSAPLSLSPYLGSNKRDGFKLSHQVIPPATTAPCSFPLNLGFSSVQSLSHVWLFVTQWTAVCQASLSITNSRSLLRLMSFELVMPSTISLLS